MISDARGGAIVVAGVLLAGAALQPLARSLDRAPRPVTSSGAEAAGQAGAAVWGELRGLIADGLWLRTYAAWARQDLPATRRWIHLVTAIDDRPLYFWLNGARMLAYDVPRWRVAPDFGRDGAPPGRAPQTAEEQTTEALDYLAAALRCHPASADICIEIANIHLNLRKDVAAAAGWYRRAAESPDAPYFAARLYAEMLCREGRYREAHGWLCSLHPTLPTDVPAAMPDVILMRIKSLETSLSLPESERYRPEKPGYRQGARTKMD